MLSDLLPADYIRHLSLLVSAMHLLLNDMILLADIDLAHNLLHLFYKLTCQLYPMNICTMNLHLLIHLAKFVHSWGPLRQLLPMKCKQLARQVASPVSTFIKSLAETETKDAQYSIEVKGCITHKQVDDSIANALFSANFIDTLHPLPKLPTCERIRYNSTLHSATNGKKRARDGSICIFKYESTLQFGSITKFCFAKHQVVAILRVFTLIDQSILDSLRAPTLPEVLPLSKSINKFIFCVEKLSLSNGTVAIPATAIHLKCIHIPVKGSPTDFTVVSPNMYEHH